MYESEILHWCSMWNYSITDAPIQSQEYAEK